MLLEIVSNFLPTQRVQLLIFGVTDDGSQRTRGEDLACNHIAGLLLLVTVLTTALSLSLGVELGREIDDATNDLSLKEDVHNERKTAQSEPVDKGQMVAGA